MAELEGERDLLVEALVLLTQRQAELEQRIATLEQSLASSTAVATEPSPALRGLVEDLRANRPPVLAAPHEAVPHEAVPRSPQPVVAEKAGGPVRLPRLRHLDSALIALGVLVLVYAGLYQLAQALGFG